MLTLRHQRRALGRVPLVFYAHPFEVAIAGLYLIAGIQSLANANARPVSLERALPGVVVIAWQAGTIFGAILVLVGLSSRLRAGGRAAEKAGLWVLAGVSSAYAVALLATLGNTATYAAAELGALGLGCVLRARAIRKTELVILEQLRTANGDPTDLDTLRELVDGRPPQTRRPRLRR